MVVTVANLNHAIFIRCKSIVLFAGLQKKMCWHQIGKKQRFCMKCKRVALIMCMNGPQKKRVENSFQREIGKEWVFFLVKTLTLAKSLYMNIYEKLVVRMRLWCWFCNSPTRSNNGYMGHMRCVIYIAKRTPFFSIHSQCTAYFVEKSF